MARTPAFCPRTSRTGARWTFMKWTNLIAHFVISVLLGCVLPWSSFKQPSQEHSRWWPRRCLWLLPCVLGRKTGLETGLWHLSLEMEQDSGLWECGPGLPPAWLGWGGSSPLPHACWICACLGHKTKLPCLLSSLFAYCPLCCFHLLLLSHIRVQRKDLSLNTENMRISIA